VCVVMLGNRRRLVRGVGLAWSALGLGAVLLGVVSSPAVAATGSWSTPVDLSADGYAADTQVSVNASGTAVAVWRGYDGSNTIVQSVSSTDGGVNWSPTVSNLSAAGRDAYHPQISVDAAGTAVAVWNRSNGTNNIVQSVSSTDGGVTWSPTVSNLSAAGGSAIQPQISVNAAGIAVAVWTRNDGSNTIVQSVSSTDGGVNWSPAVSNLSAAGGNAELAQISVNAAGTAVAVWRRSNGTNFIVQSASSTDGGVNWSPTVNNLSAAGADAYSPQISVDAAGTAVAVWNRNDGSNFIVQSVSSTDGGVSWSTPEDLSAAGGSAGEPQLSVNEEGIAVAVWNRYDGSNPIVQSVLSTDGGVTWSTPANDLSAAGGSAVEPQISAAGTVIAIWDRNDGSTHFVQASSLTLPSSANSPSLANTGATSGTATTTLSVGAGLLTAGALALVLLRRRLARR